MTWQLLILEKEPLIIIRWPQKCSQVTGKNIKGRNPKVQFFGGHPVAGIMHISHHANQPSYLCNGHHTYQHQPLCLFAIMPIMRQRPTDTEFYIIIKLYRQAGIK